MTRDPSGIIWFNVQRPGRGALGRLDPKTEKIEVFCRRRTCRRLGGATTVDWDGKGKIWVSSPDGALRFDPATREIHRVQIAHPQDAERHRHDLWRRRRPRRQRLVGGDGDRHHRPRRRADRQVSEVKLPPRQAEDRDRRRSSKFYATFAAPDFNTPLPWDQGPRRMGTDKNGDVLWVGDSWGGNLARIDIHTMKIGFVPLPGPGVMQPYHIAVDKPPRRLAQYLDLGRDHALRPGGEHNGRRSTCRRAAPRRATSRCSSATARWRW